MKISNETKVGILSVVALVLLILGFNFLKGRDLFNNSRKIYMVFSDLGSLAKSNEVKINGFVIGKVYELNAKDKNVTGIVATINLSEDVNIPNDSKAYISAPLIGSSFIVIEKGASATLLKSGDTLQTRADGGIFGDVKEQLNPTLTKLREGIDSVKVLLSNVNGIFTVEAKANLQFTLSNLSQASSSLNKMMDSENGALAKSLKNVSAITENLKNNNDSINAIISNAKSATGKLAQLDLKPTMDSLSAAISSMKSAMAKLNSTDGSLGALINDKALYNRLHNTILSAELLLDDLRTNPKRYVNFSLIGRKDKNGPITSPAKKDTIPK